MGTFLRLFGSLLRLVYHCFDRIVIFGYLPLLSRPEHIVYFFRMSAALAASPKRRWASASTITSAGSKPPLATTSSRWSGLSNASAKKITPVPLAFRLILYWVFLL